MATFVKNQANWKYEFESTRGMVGRDLKDRGARGVGYAAMQVGVKTGTLQRSLKYRVGMGGGVPQVLIGSDDEIAYLHHEGSRPHQIKPRYAKTLRFMQNGRIRFAKRVYHPGTRPNRYLTDNLYKMVK